MPARLNQSCGKIRDIKKTDAFTGLRPLIGSQASNSGDEQDIPGTLDVVVPKDIAGATGSFEFVFGITRT